MARDARRFIEVLEAEGELVRVPRTVQRDGELSEIQRVALERDGPALLFESIAGHESSWCRRMLCGELGCLRRAALMLGLPKTASLGDASAMLARAFAAPVAPVVVASGPVKEHVRRGADIDIREIPAPVWHPADGGRYINTWCGVVTADPDTGVLNVGLYRGQILGPDRIGVKLIASKGWGAHFRRCRKLGRDMPVSVFYGGDPALGFMAGCPLPEPPEYDVAGAIMGQAVELVKCETNDLLVPAHAEIIIEGHIPVAPESYEIEGPFGEWTGHYSLPQKAPVIHVDCITHRTDPIFRGCLACTPSNVSRESAVTGRLGQCAIVRHVLGRAGVTGIVDVETGPRRVPSLVLVNIVREDRDHPARVAQALWPTVLNMKPVRNVVVVNGDVDVHSLDSVLNHLSRLSYFGRSPRLVAATAPAPEGGMLIDATFVPAEDTTEEERRRFEIGPECSGGFPEWRRVVEENWKDYGF